MTKRDKIGLAIIVALFFVLGVILFLTVERPTGPTRGFEDNVIIERRMRILEQQR
jgi:hypothetical protein